MTHGEQRFRDALRGRLLASPSRCLSAAPPCVRLCVRLQLLFSRLLLSAPSPFPCCLLSTLPLSHAGLRQTRGPVLLRSFPRWVASIGLPSLASVSPSAKWRENHHHSHVHLNLLRVVSMEGLRLHPHVPSSSPPWGATVRRPREGPRLAEATQPAGAACLHGWGFFHWPLGRGGEPAGSPGLGDTQGGDGPPCLLRGQRPALWNTAAGQTQTFHTTWWGVEGGGLRPGSLG